VATTAAILARPLGDILLKAVKPIVKKTIKKIKEKLGKKVKVESVFDRRKFQRSLRK
jgi:Cu/Ag efflux pump CusA